ncbi:MAG: stage II sporulation protein M, partial [Acidimicrobiales bacterium]
MDIDRFLLANEATWRRLATLTDKAGRSAGRLPAEELDELVSLYQRAGTHLSYSRTAFGDPGLESRLSRLVAAAGGVVYGSRPRTWRGVGRFFGRTFPAALWHVRPFLLAAALLMFVPAAIVAAHLSTDRPALDARASPAERAAFVQAGADYYSEQPSAQFASQVFTNNVRVAMLAFSAGIVVCAFSALVLVQNGTHLGEFVAVFVDAGKGTELFGLLVPHGVIELSAVVVAGAAGLRLGWTIIDPGDRPRGAALAEEGRRAVALVMGTAAMLLVAGTIEGFVTGSALPTALRVGLGLAVGTAFWVYAWAFGRRAAAEGRTGNIGEADAGWS